MWYVCKKNNQTWEDFICNTDQYHIIYCYFLCSHTMADDLNKPASICCWPLSYSVIVLQFSLSSWGRLIHEDIMSVCDWLAAAFGHRQVWWCGFSLSLALLTHEISSSPISSDVLLLDATIVFGIVLDIVLALIINCSNYFGPYPSFWKQCMEQEKPVCTQAHRGLQYVGALVWG